MYHLILGSRVIKKKKNDVGPCRVQENKKAWGLCVVFRMDDEDSCKRVGARGPTV